MKFRACFLAAFGLSLCFLLGGAPLTNSPTVTSTYSGLAPKSPGNANKVLNGATAPAYVNPPALSVIGSTTTVSAASVNTTETALMTYTVPAGTLASGVTIPVDLMGRWTRSGIGEPSIRLRLRLGGTSGTVLIDTGTIGGSSASTDAAIVWHVPLTTATAGASGTLWQHGWAFDASTTASTISLRILNSAGANNGAFDNAAIGTTDLTVAEDLVWTVQFSGNTAGNSVSIDQAQIGIAGG